MNEIISLKNVQFAFEKTVILKNINISIEKGSFSYFFGPNGGGKTTLLKLLLGLLKPQVGDIKIFGLSPEKARKKIGYIPQHFNYDKNFPINTLDLVLLGAIKKSSFFFYSNKTVKKGKKLLEMFGLEEVQKELISSLSLGQMQRALIAKALINDPEILILDEPTAHLDPEAQEKFYKMIFAYKKIKTILIVTHDLKLITKESQNIFLVDHFIEKKLPDQVCEHFSLGLYHPIKKEFHEQ